MGESKNNKSPSVAAFLFMPQFGLSFRGGAHIVPIFMRTLALMFAQAGLISYNHPASRYGIEGVKKYSFSELMGEAWFNLRKGNATGQQWGLFLSVIFMIAVFFAAIASFFLNIAVGLGTSAQAQVFSHPGTPYGSGNETDISKMQSTIDVSGSGPMFDSRTAYDLATPDATRASLDLGLMVLDKALRQSTVGNGGAMQNGLTALMQVYNTGILVVAAVMIFWMILSIVVDTAKSGTVGGGRHNMVWTPIRVVFALGIMIPLGTTGFSSGQFAVMKLAEWGSNFGTQAWAAYVEDVINESSLLVQYDQKGFSDSASAMAVGLTRVKVCQVAWNAELANQGELTDTYRVKRKDLMRDFKAGVVIARYSNETSANLCGTVKYTAIGGTTSQSWGDQMATPTTTTLAGAAASFQAKMKVALKDMLDDNDGPNPPGALVQQAVQFACGYVGRHMRPNSGTGPVLASGLCSSDTGCNSSATSFPDISCHKTMISSARAQLFAVYSSAKGDLETYIATPMVADMKNKGWAGMGNWPYYISVLNGVAHSARDVGVTIEPGQLWSPPAENVSSSWWSRLWGVDMAAIEQTVRIVNADYTRWWGEAIAKEAAQDSAAEDRKNSVNSAGVDGETFRAMTSDSSDAQGFAASVVGVVMPSDANFLEMFSMAADDKTYPFARLVQVGHNIMSLFLASMAVLTLLQIALSLQIMGTGATAFVSSALANGLSSICGMGVLAGMMLAFYVPILPLIRTTFSVLTWIISVFEAVAMVPIAALAHLTSEGEGIAAGAKTCWILWLNILLRPVLVVIGFVASMLVFNTFAVYFHINFSHGVHALRSEMGFFTRMLSYVAYTVVYVGAIYTAANSTFKLLDLIPDAMMRWMGGTPDKSFDDNSTAGMLYAASNIAGSFKNTAHIERKGPKKTGMEKDKDDKPPA